MNRKGFLGALPGIFLGAKTLKFEEYPEEKMIQVDVPITDEPDLRGSQIVMYTYEDYLVNFRAVGNIPLGSLVELTRNGTAVIASDRVTNNIVGICVGHEEVLGGVIVKMVNRV